MKKLSDFKYITRVKKRGRPSNKELTALAILNWYYEKHSKKIIDSTIKQFILTGKY